MTISEFIYGFDDGSTYADYDEQGNVYIYDYTYDSVMAQLGSNSYVWEVEDDSFTMSPSLLRLMAELADTPPAKREMTPRYVILNGEPEKGFWQVFIVNSYGLICYRCVDNSGGADNPDNLEELAKFAYTRKELNELKNRLSPRMQKAIDVMTVPLEEALKMGENNDD